MIATARPNRPRQIRRRELEQFRRSIESWERQRKEAGRGGDVELAAGYAEDVADLHAILRLIETGALHEATESIDRLDTLVRDQIPIRLYDAIAPGNGRFRRPRTSSPLASDSNLLTETTTGRTTEYWNQTPAAITPITRTEGTLPLRKTDDLIAAPCDRTGPLYNRLIESNGRS